MKNLLKNWIVWVLVLGFSFPYVYDALTSNESGAKQAPKLFEDDPDWEGASARVPDPETEAISQDAVDTTLLWLSVAIGVACCFLAWRYVGRTVLQSFARFLPAHKLAERGRKIDESTNDVGYVFMCIIIGWGVGVFLFVTFADYFPKDNGVALLIMGLVIFFGFPVFVGYLPRLAWWGVQLFGLAANKSKEHAETKRAELEQQTFTRNDEFNNLVSKHRRNALDFIEQLRGSLGSTQADKESLAVLDKIRSLEAARDALPSSKMDSKAIGHAIAETEQKIAELRSGQQATGGKLSEQAIYDELVAKQGRNPHAYAMRAMATLQLDPKRALADCEQALALVPHYYYAMYAKGMVLVQLGKPTQAKTSFEQALQISDSYNIEYSQPKAGLTHALVAQKKYKQATTTGATSIETSDANIGLAMAYMNSEQWDKAAHHYNMAYELRNEPYSIASDMHYHTGIASRALYGKALALHRSGRNELALHTVQQYFAMNPKGTPAVWRLLCRCDPENNRSHAEAACTKLKCDETVALQWSVHEAHEEGSGRAIIESYYNEPSDLKRLERLGKETQKQLSIS